MYATVTGQGETYYDSVSMFIFFLLAGRYIEHNARLKAATMANDLVVVEPILVQKIAEDKASAALILERLNQQSQADVAPLVASDMNNAVDTNDDISTNLKASPLPNFMQDMDANVQALTQKVAAAWQQSAASVTELHAADKSMVTAQSLQVGDIIMIEAGAEIISDGILLSPTATVSQSLLTGEGDLIIKRQGDYIVGGAQNDSQPFEMLVTALPEDRWD
jgi:Cu2+-exporting ATPase